jgi:hypothetical protein
LTTAPPARRLFLPALFLTWGAFTAWCVWGFPPCVDLPAHGAQMETLATLLRGDAAVAQFYRVTFPLGYGLPFWLFLPVAFVANGAVAARLAMWTALMLYPLSHLALVRAFKRPDWTLLLGLPLAFNISYWYGLLPGLFAQPLVFFGLALFARALDSPRAKWLVLLNVAATAALLSHLVAFAAMGFVMAAYTLTRRPLLPALRVLALGLALPAALSLSKVWSMATRAVTPGEWPATVYDFSSHFNWFFKNYRPEGQLAALVPLVVACVFALVYLVRRRKEPIGPAVMLAAMVALYLATPKTLSGIFLISVRLPALAGMLALLVADLPASRALRGVLIGACFLSLVETAAFHVRFARAVDGLDEMVREPPKGRHGYESLVGREVLGSKHVYLDHLGQWWTAKWGGVGHNFFADAEHHPVRFREGTSVPADLWDETPERVAFFDELLVYGDGPLPANLAGWREVQRAGAWRKLSRPAR